ncbi:hypothetical protein MSAN_01608200 [Mycena sanguinolenta]|uniref:Uncharacterized protein n=1 Tax=Mycena sanguinolenta TaxID=230812 RepID=A0A8H6Y3I5_9AGAR|nr:hypothetical protein MSAN_01608200 [Mycena sanguinolenta]
MAKRIHRLSEDGTVSDSDRHAFDRIAHSFPSSGAYNQTEFPAWLQYSGSDSVSSDIFPPPLSRQALSGKRRRQSPDLDDYSTSATHSHSRIDSATAGTSSMPLWSLNGTRPLSAAFDDPLARVSQNESRFAAIDLVPPRDDVFPGSPGVYNPRSVKQYTDNALTKPSTYLLRGHLYRNTKWIQGKEKLLVLETGSYLLR